VTNKILPTNKKSRRGVAAVEAVFALPVLIMAVMIIMEFANIALTIDMGEAALQRAVQQFRLDDSFGDDAESALRQNMVDASHGYVKQENIVNVSIEEFASLDAMGGGSTDEDNEDSEDEASSNNLPAWRITVDIRKDFITPLSRLLAFYDNDFQYRYEQVLSYLPQEED